MKIAFASSSSFGEIVLKEMIKNNTKPSLVITTPDKKMGRGQKIKPIPIKETAINNEIRVKEAENKKSFHEIIEKENPDAVIVAGMGIIIAPETLSLSSFINIHPSLLPLYRGPSPIQWSIMDKVEKSGVTIIKMNEKIDQGPIIGKREVPFHSKINYKEAEKILAIHGAELVLELIPAFLEEKIIPEEQNEKEATYTQILKKENGKIDWTKPADIIESKIRALNPWPGTYTKANGKNIKILKASIQEQTENGPFGSPGTIYLGTNDSIAVQTGKDFLLIEELQEEGKKPTPAKDFLLGNIDLIGSVLHY